MVVEDREPVLPLAGEQVLRLRGVGEPFDGVSGHAEPPLDRAQALSCLQECVDGGVPGPGATGEPVPGRPWRTEWFFFRG
ncbi:hypothetical protein [Streptomyces sp. NPDC005989]|uniref:hypothetical protein n=1 Tax=Streptomyces sp. NPDC005989 TaxID=3156727 RepID=UPI003405E942